MKIQIRGVEYSYTVKEGTDPKRIPWLMLHGFTGTKATFSEVTEALVTETIISLDLVGHGETAYHVAEKRYSMEEQILDIALFLEELKLPKVLLLGYSMGGRVALGFAANYPDKVNKLILESSSPGLKTNREQEMRREHDAKLAKSIIKDGLTKFVESWENLPLFATQKQLSTEIKSRIRDERLSQNPIGLAISLEQLGTGSQPSYWQELKQIQFPVYLLIGETDLKFKQLAEEMGTLFPHSKLVEFAGAGHAPHIEQPMLFAKYLQEIADNQL